jgi:O-antigen ligase
MKTNASQKFLHTFVVVVAFIFLTILMNRRIISLWAIPIGENTFAKVGSELGIWAFLFVLFLWLAYDDGALRSCWLVFRQNWPVLLFMGLATLSIFWTVHVQVTLYKIIVLFVTTFAASYVGVSMGLDRFLRVLAWIGGIAAVFSLWLALVIPEEGTHIGHPYFGSWRGLFWSRGRFGGFMALSNLVFLFQSARYVREYRQLIPNLFFYGLTVVLVFLSRSATSIIIVVFLHFCFILMLAWLRWKHLLKSKHYIAFGIAGGILAIIIFTNLDFLFDLLGRETNLTGRVPMWSYLLSEIFTQKPVLGYGFGAIWEHNSFRYFMQEIVNWPYPVIGGDNGFLDVLLNIGVVGLLSFLVVLGLAVVRAFRFTLSKSTLIGFFPLFLIGYVFVINMSLSYLFEIEFFVWFLLASALFITTTETA